MIALLPLLTPKFWHHRFPIIAGIMFLVGLSYYWVLREDLHPWLHEMKEYVSFIALLFALFVISGGIMISVSRKATPLANCTLLLLGAVIANIFGTTGAAMLLIRPYIRINKGHIRPYHIVFFIFTVANCGGCLTPIGDPPLFLGYLKGVPFWWFLENAWEAWLLCLLVLIVIFWVFEKIDHGKAERHDWGEHDTGPAVRINGIHNFLFIIVVLIAVFQQSVFSAIEALGKDGVTVMELVYLLFSREVMMVAAALISRWVTSIGIYERNEFSWFPIKEVVILFLAIFSTMVPCLEWLDANARKLEEVKVGGQTVNLVADPGRYYYITGTLSAFLDNAPTWVTFFTTQTAAAEKENPEHLQHVRDAAVRVADGDHWADASEELGLAPPERLTLETLMIHHGDKVRSGTVSDSQIKAAYMVADPDRPIRPGGPPLAKFLLAISLAAVFFGACTYIGNAPNFMVKSIAESSGIRMPSFLGYLFKFAIPILLPVYIFVWFIFLR
ncbi:MAG: hypothetical protein CMJ49_12020 [Planctomycetaceae bacterium]|nr:hypothetical protein [Planctomycetaceae bacterium]